MVKQLGRGVGRKFLKDTIVIEMLIAEFFLKRPDDHQMTSRGY
jgi:hypothetical protein